MTHDLPAELHAIVDAWEGEQVVSRYDEPTGTWIFIALHSSARGMPTGGTRIRHYPHLADGLRDAMNLAEGMTAKWAVIGADKGGGKAVLAVPRELVGEEREGLLRRFGTLVDSLDGRFATGEDLGTTPEDMAIVRQETRYVHGLDPDGTMTDPGPLTAAGVAYGIDAALAQVFGDDPPQPATVLVQGVGDVGAPLCKALAERDFRLLVSDLDPGRVEEIAGRLGAEVIDPARALATECDVLAPCAVGGILNEATIPALRCRIVAGSANNQLAEPSDAERLAARGILYVPDYVINAGGALAFGLHSAGLTDQDALRRRMPAIGELVAAILKDAEAENETPLAAAHRRVQRALSAN
jgi:leucine dehydrogenase